MKIYVVYHKNTPLIQNNILTPIHAGKALSNISLNMIGDDTGDNISKKNPEWCELSVMYWMWKNVDTDYYGLFHYRRVYDFFDTKDRFFYSNTKLLDRYGLSEDCLLRECVDFDAIMPPLWDVHPSQDPKNKMSIYDFYTLDHIENDLKVTLEIINEKYPEYSKTASLVMHRQKAYFCNMFIMKKELFHQYATWLFDILFEVEKRITVERDDPYQRRVFGFLSERLINIFIFHQQCNNPNFKLKEVSNIPMGIFDNKYPIGSIFNDEPSWKNGLNYSITPSKKCALPVISVIVPVYNVEKYLAACLNSIIGQSIKQIEVIIINDGSTDNSQKIIDSYANVDKRITAIIQKNKGLSAARNEGLRHATGKYIFFIDSDDYIKYNALEKMFNIAESNESEIVCSTIEVIDANTETILNDHYCNQIHLPKKIIENAFSIKDIIPYIFNLPVFAWNKLYLRSFLCSIDAKFPEGLYFEDNPFFFKVMLNAKSISYLSEHCYVYRKNRVGSILTTQSEKFFDFFEIINMSEKILKETPYWDSLKYNFFTYKLNLLIFWGDKTHISLKNKYLNRLKIEYLSYDLNEYSLNKLQQNSFETYMKIISNNFYLSNNNLINDIKNESSLHNKNINIHHKQFKKTFILIKHFLKYFLSLTRIYRNEKILEDLKKEVRRLKSQIGKNK